MLAALLVLFTPLAAPPATPPATPDRSTPSVLIMPLTPKNGASEALAEQLSDVLTHEASGIPGFRVVSVAEVRGALTQEQVRQLADCDAVGCAAEIGGALDTDQVVVGSLGQVGDEYLLTVTRLQSRTAMREGSAVLRVPVNPPSLLLDAMPDLARRVFGVAPPRVEPAVTRAPSTNPALAAAPPTAPVVATAPAADPPNRMPWVLRGLGAAGVAGALPPALVAMALVGVVLTVLVLDGGPQPPGGTHRVTFPVAVAGDLAGAGAVLLGMVALGGVLASGVIIVSSWVVP